MVMLPDARGPDGVRIYAIGDVHGCREALAAMLARVDSDLAARPVAAHRLVLLGDYVDRGPDSAGVLDLLADRTDADRSLVALLGNHDAMLRGVIETGDAALLAGWLDNGGRATLASYGVEAGFGEIAAALAAAMPEAHREMLSSLLPLVRAGDFVFAHAGIRPGVPLNDQSIHDLLWIRHEFLSCGDDLGAVIVHGHTPSDGIALRRNRIGIDTGACFGGWLTCLVVEEDRIGLLGENGVEPLDLAAPPAPSQPG